MKTAPTGLSRGARAAWAMQESLRELQSRSQGTRKFCKLKMGIGLHIGDLVEGNVGSRDRVKYGVCRRHGEPGRAHPGPIP